MKIEVGAISLDFSVSPNSLPTSVHNNITGLLDYFKTLYSDHIYVGDYDTLEVGRKFLGRQFSLNVYRRLDEIILLGLEKVFTTDVILTDKGNRNVTSTVKQSDENSPIESSTIYDINNPSFKRNAENVINETYDNSKTDPNYSFKLAEYRKKYKSLFLIIQDCFVKLLDAYTTSY